jgi:uncharacterized protein YnzC (UPF0291/DUF896 family)
MKNIIKNKKKTRIGNVEPFGPIAKRMISDQKKWLSKHAHEITVYDMDGNLLTPEKILE